jgi:hypothetical protein
MGYMAYIPPFPLGPVTAVLLVTGTSWSNCFDMSFGAFSRLAPSFLFRTPAIFLNLSFAKTQGE